MQRKSFSCSPDLNGPMQIAHSPEGGGNASDPTDSEPSEVLGDASRRVGMACAFSTY